MNTLQQCTKWRQSKGEIHPGDIVLVMDDDVPPLRWPLGQITQVHPGQDNIIRVVTLRMKYGSPDKNGELKFKEFKRPVSKLIYLPTQPDERI